MILILYQIIILLLPSLNESFDPSCNPMHIKEAVDLNYYCQPLMKIVRLALPIMGNFTNISPEFISVKRCGGGCHNPFHSCLSSKASIKKVPVILSSCGLEIGTCKKFCTMFEVTEDINCDCNCSPVQCRKSSGQIFNQRTCSCECSEELRLMRKCEEREREWNRATCECKCPLENQGPCSTGERSLYTLKLRICF